MLVRLARRPLAWLVMAEIAVCAALVLTAAHLVAAAAAGPQAGGGGIAVPPFAAASAAPAPAPAVSAAAGAALPHGRPGLGTGGAFLGGLLDGLNRDEAAFEQAEWAALQALSGAIRVYVEKVMLPAVEKAARSRSGAG